MAHHQFVVCTDNSGYEVSLEVRKLYEVIVDADADSHDQLRVIDESGEDYLYPKAFFESIELPTQVVDRIVDAA